MNKKIKSYTQTKEYQKIYTLGQIDPVSITPFPTQIVVTFTDETQQIFLGNEFDMSMLDPTSPLIHMDCDSLEDYTIFVGAGHFIKDGYWYNTDDFNQSEKISMATQKEILIAKTYDSIKYKKKTRFELIAESE